MFDMARIVPALLAGCLIMFCICLPPATMASDTDLALKLYKEGKYRQALAEFSAAAKKSPADATTHYYMAMCYQRLNQMLKARQEYQWVLRNSTDSRLKANSQAALNSLKKNVSVGTATIGAVPATGKPRVLDFYADWCGPCKAMDPLLNEAQIQYQGRVDFQKIDIQDPRNQRLVAKYGISVIPVYVFLDANGTVVSQTTGTMPKERLLQHIQQIAGR